MSEVFIVTENNWDNTEILKVFDKVSTALAYVRTYLGFDIENFMNHQGNYEIYEKDSHRTHIDIVVKRVE